MKRDRLSLMVGPLAWLAAVVYFQPHPLDTAWGQVLLLFAPLVLVPIGLRLIGTLSWPGRLAETFQQFGAMMLFISFMRPTGNEAALWSLPWLVITALIALEGVLRIRRRGLLPVHETCINTGLIFLLVGGLWTTASRAGMRPMGFEDTVVLLTANHFHLAGFVLPIVAGLCGRSLPGRFSKWTALLVMAGVPLVAIGITSTKYDGPHILEGIAALVMAASGVGVAWLHLRLSARQSATGRVLFVIAGLSLAVGMALAATYGMRFWTRSDGVLTIPWMRALHGSVNVFGFGLASMLGWLLAGEPRPQEEQA